MHLLYQQLIQKCMYIFLLCGHKCSSYVVISDAAVMSMRYARYVLCTLTRDHTHVNNILHLLTQLHTSNVHSPFISYVCRES